MSLHKKTHFRKIHSLVNIAITHIFISQDNLKIYFLVYNFQFQPSCTGVIGNAQQTEQ